MSEKITGLEILKKYKSGETDWLPLIDLAFKIVPKRNEFGDVNIGWNAGLIDDNRPFYCECWATSGITMITLYVSTKGIEDYDAMQLEKLYTEIGYYKPKEGYEVKDSEGDGLMVFTDKNNNDFFALSIVVGVGDEPARITGAIIYPFSILNEFNSEN